MTPGKPNHSLQKKNTLIKQKHKTQEIAAQDIKNQVKSNLTN
jgi:hypothetical protein